MLHNLLIYFYSVKGRNESEERERERERLTLGHRRDGGTLPTLLRPNLSLFHFFPVENGKDISIGKDEKIRVFYSNTYR